MVTDLIHGDVSGKWAGGTDTRERLTDHQKDVTRWLRECESHSPVTDWEDLTGREFVRYGRSVEGVPEAAIFFAVEDHAVCGCGEDMLPDHHLHPRWEEGEEMD